ncbi:DUF4214 domain-containing protein [Methylosinus sp. KRF6]|uniref:DUF4214 domain-containing protein n=1 Tax=Methylosinus sp. KRF6 TaxID=2846853 RepID=UPI001C0E0725|nr:DUF4214 domain-containing protein [Methylosinus sp. KRF6]MBU3890840.1 DUF4214 domain-containing protein [Methylosinus sp. KRF6]
MTPGHLFYTPDGGFRRIDEIMAGDGKIVLADGTVIEVTAERVVYSEETAHLYEQAERIVYATEGGLALAPRIEHGWRTYNFEVEELHTYIAGGVRVHNDCDTLGEIATDIGSFFDDLGNELSSLFDDIGAGLDNFFSGFNDSGLFSDFSLDFGDFGFGDFGFGDFGASFDQASWQQQADWDWQFWDDWWSAWPVILDLDGNGIKIDPLTSSNTYFDMAGDGYQHRTAWAGAGDAVLAFDANNDGVINQKNEIVFTEWDPTATSDMQALLDVFDTNHNGKLDAGDAQFAQFKLVVTNADGSKTLQTLVQAGIASIDLKEDNYAQTFVDGSSIDGQTIFTRTNGATGIAASVSLVYDATGHALQTTTSTAPNGAVTVDNKAYAADGRLASETISVTSADGSSRTLSQDVDGDGVIDLVQSQQTVVNGDGSKTVTLTDATAGGVNLDRIVTTTSADGRSTTIQRDMDANGVFEQTETLVTEADGSKTNIVSNFGDDGTLISKSSYITSADGLTRTDRTDENGDNVWDTTSTDASVVNWDGSRTETVTVTNANGSLRASTTIQTSADGRTRTKLADIDGNGTIDLKTAEVVTTNADGSYWTTTTERNGDDTLRNQAKTLLSADNLSKTTYVDVNGDGYWERVTTDVTVVAPDGTRTETTTDLNADGSVRARTIVVKGADGRSRTIQFDQNGDGVFDTVETIVVAANGSSVDTISNYTPRNGLIDKTVVTTSADGLTRVTQVDADANGSWDTTTTETTLKNGDGSSTKTTMLTNSNGSIRENSVVTTSANGLTVTTQADLDGNGAYDLTTTDARSVAADNSHVETVSRNNGNGSLRDQTITSVSADRRSTTINHDIDGNGANDQTETIQIQSNGATIDTTSNFSSDGGVKNQRTTTESADGLSNETDFSELVTHYNWIWVGYWIPIPYQSLDVVKTVTDVTVLNGDGSRVGTYTQYNGSTSGSIREQIVTTVSANGLSISKQWTGSNSGASINLASSDVTTYNSDGSTTRVVIDQSTDPGMMFLYGSNAPILIDKAVTTVDDSNLATTYQLDVNGDGTYDTIDVSTVTVDGAAADTLTAKNLDGSLRRKEATTVSWDALRQNLARDANGDGVYEHFENSGQEASGASGGVIWETNSSGALKDRIVTLDSANGLTALKAIDANGDRSVDWSRSSVERLNADGSHTVTTSDFNSNGTLRARIVTTVSANGLSKTSQIDLNGLGSAIETETDLTTLNADGSVTREVADFYAGGALKGKSVLTTSANGKSATTTIDIDGDNVTDKTVSVTEGADGVKVSTITFKDGSTATTTTSFDGLTTTMNTSAGITQNRTELGDGTGSYNWSSKDSYGNTIGSSSHTIDENKVDTYAYSSSNASGTIRIESDALGQYLDLAMRLYDAAFDRDMLVDEKELIGKYINSSTDALNSTQLANDLMNATEFSTRYGGLSNLQFVERVFENALGRAPSVAELTGYLGQLNAGALSRADVMLQISESAEHVLVGNVHATTNNSVQSMASLASDHIVDQQLAKDMVTRVYQTAFGRDPTATELSDGYQAIVGGGANEAGLANNIVSVQWVWWPYFWNPSIFDQTYGALSNTDFVTRIYLNSLGRNPTATESSDWVSMLDNNSVSRGDMIYALAESADHLAYIGSQAGQAIAASYQALNFAENAIVRVTGSGNTINAGSGDVLTIGGNGAWGANNVVNISNGSASLLADAHMDIVGSRNVVTADVGSNMGIFGDDNIVSAKADGLWVGGSGTIVNGSNNTVTVFAGVDANIVGDANTVYGETGAKITLSTNGQNGSGDVVNMSDGSLVMSGGAKATLNGSGNTVTFEFGDALTLTGSNNKVVFGAGNDSVDDTGSFETFIFEANFGQDQISGFDGSDRMQIDSSIFADWAHLIGATQQVGADTVITASAADAITLKNVAVSSLNQNQFQFA